MERAIAQTAVRQMRINGGQVEGQGFVPNPRRGDEAAQFLQDCGPRKFDQSASRFDRIGMRSKFLRRRMAFSGNRYPPRIKSGAGIFRDIR